MPAGEARPAAAPPARGLGRRTVFSSFVSLAVGLPLHNTGHPADPIGLAELSAEWRSFADRHLSRDGRILASEEGDSHTEGQGIGMLVAAVTGDRAAFEAMRGWTRQHLRRGDGLHAWRWSPTGVTRLPDTNNATDGDILIAWALQRAATTFNRPDYAEEARGIADSVLRLCTREVGQRLVLLPGLRGFERRDHLILNPSYYIFPALLDFERLVPDPAWRKLVSDGLEICCREARFGRWMLPADWIELPREVGTPPRPAADWPARFSWDALRVPLYLAWGRRLGEPLLHDAAGFWRDWSPNPLPAWVNLRNDALAPYAGHAGVRATARIVSAIAGGDAHRPALPGVAEATDYYGAALCLMARLAWLDTRRTAMS